MDHRTGIAIWVNDNKQKLVSGLKGNTTVQDVIRVLIPDSTPDSHGLFQTWCDTQEQILRPRAKILRVLQSLSSEDQRHVRFFIRDLLDDTSPGLSGVSTEIKSDTSSSSSQWSSASLQQNTIEQYSVTRETYRESFRSRNSVLTGNNSCGLHSRESGSVHNRGRSSSINSWGSNGSLHNSDTGSYTSQISSRSYQRTTYKNSRSNSSVCSQNPDESGVDKLLRLMKEQELKLSQQMAQIRKIETEIEAIETQNHVSRMEKDGLNYIQQGYMVPKTQPQVSPPKQSQEIPQIELCRGMSPRRLRQDISILENEIIEEQAEITIAEQAQEMDSAASMDSHILEELKELKDAVRNSIQVSLAQDQEMSQMNVALQEMQSEMESKAQCILELVSELNEEETVDKAELTEYSMLLQHRLGTNTNLVEDILQRYRANIQNIEVQMYDDHSGSDSGVSSQEPESLENSSDDSQDYEKQNSTLGLSTFQSCKSDSSGNSSTDSEPKSASKDVNEGDLSSESKGPGFKSLLNETPQAPLASLDSTLLSLPSSQGSSVDQSGQASGHLSGQPSPELSVLSDTAISKPAHQISIIQQNLTLPNETLPNDTLQPLDVLVTKETVVTSTPVPQSRPTPRARPPTPKPPPQPQRKVAFSDHDSIREITMYSMDDTTLVEDELRDGAEEEEEEDTVVEDQEQYFQCQGQMPADRFVVSLHPQHLPQSAAPENRSYQEAIYNYSPSDASHTNFLHAGPASRLHRKMKLNSKARSGDMKHKILDKLLFLPKLAKRSKSARCPKLCTFIEDTFEDSYRYALMGHRTGKPLTPLRHSVSQNDVTREETINDVTLLRSYTVGDLGKIGYSWIEDFRETPDDNVSQGFHKTSLETLV